MTVHIFGIRHHGPGSARSLRGALESLQPDVLLVEGPPEAGEILPLVQSEAMQPPVAMLIYSPSDPACAAYYPFTEFSPEWQAFRYGLAKRIPIRMMDLALAYQMAMAPKPAPEPAEPEGPQDLLAEESYDEDLPEEETPDEADPAEEISRNISGDPLRALAEAGGYSESEQWWEHMIEQRRGSEDLFGAVLEALTAVREAAPVETNPIGMRREAAMRQVIRAAEAEGFQRIAVVCGAWHAPALVDLSDERGDAALLRGLPKIALQATWVPWTYARLTRLSGYGAGIDSPGWYHHLWTTDQDVAVQWMVSAARLLREEGFDVSPAHIIEAVRLAETLAALRERPLPGLPELNEAVLTVFCFGNPVPMQLIEEKLIVGERIGSVPPETPMAPLQGDFEREIRRLRMKVEAYEKLVDLDLRKPTDLGRSHLLHRLTLLNVPWGKNNDASIQASARTRGGTFHEVWRLKWQPEFSIQLIEAGQWGNTIAAAAAAKVCHAADRAPDLSALTELVEDVLLAELPEAIQHLMRCLQAQASVSSDTSHLMQALPPLASVLRYGNVRQTDTAMITKVVDGLVTRICIGLPGACAALNDDAAAEMFERIMKVDDAITRMAEENYRHQWQHALAGIADQGNLHGLIVGRACRILLDQGLIDADEASRRLGLALSTASDPVQAASWAEGFLRDSGQLLIYDEGLLNVIDRWLEGLNTEIFNQLLPLLRRTFATFSKPERRSIGERIRSQTLRGKHGGHGSPQSDFDLKRADAVLPLVLRLLGIEQDQGNQS